MKIDNKKKNTWEQRKWKERDHTTLSQMKMKVVTSKYMKSLTNKFREIMIAISIKVV